MSVLYVPRIIRKFDDGIYSENDLEYSRHHTTDKLVKRSWRKLCIISIWIIVIMFDCIHAVWKLTYYFDSMWPLYIGPVIGRNVIFAMICFATSDLLILSMYIGKIMEKIEQEKWSMSGFIGDYVLDLIKNLILVGLGAGFVTFALMILDKTSLVTQLTTLCTLALLFILLYPSLDVWLLVTQREISRQRQKRAVYRTESSLNLELRLHSLCDRVDFPKNHVIITPSGSRQTSAFYYGFLGFHRIIVLQGREEVHHHQHHDDDGNGEEDNEETPLVCILTAKEIESVVAHELGHWYYTHSDLSLLFWHAIEISTVGLVYWLRSNETILRWFHLSLSSPSSLPDIDGATFLPGAFIIYYIILRVYRSFFDTLFQVYSQETEKQADVYCTVQLGYYKDFPTALIKIILAQQTTFPSSDPLYQSCYHNHPSLVQRLNFIHKQWLRHQFGKYHN